MSILFLDRLSGSLDRGELKHIDLSYLVCELGMRIEDELKSAIVLQIPRERSKYYGEKQLFGSEDLQSFLTSLTTWRRPLTAWRLLGIQQLSSTS